MGRENKMKKIIVAILVILSVSGAWAQITKDTTFSMDSVQIEADLLIGNFKNGEMIQRLEGNVILTMVSENPSENMTLNADAIDFFYDKAESKDKAPERMELKGNVRVIAEGMNITSDNAVIYLKEQRAVFDGYTEITTAERDTPITGSVMTVNFETGDIRITDLRNKDEK